MAAIELDAGQQLLLGSRLDNIGVAVISISGELGQACPPSIGGLVRVANSLLRTSNVVFGITEGL